MSNLAMRSITGLIYVLLMSAGALWSLWLLVLLLFLFTVVGSYELSQFYRTPKRQAIVVSVLSGLCFLILALAFEYFAHIKTQYFGISKYWLIAACFILPPLILLSMLKARIMVWLRAVLYIAIPLSLMIAIRSGFFLDKLGSQPWILMGVFIIIWINDTGAYLSGKYFGKHHMAPHISPKKTWEGLLGGILFAAASTYVLFRMVGVLSLSEWMVIFAVTVTLGTLGDLFESWLKRRAGVKDSGTLMPGHGGVLDRLDSLLLAVPFVYAALLLIFAD